MIIPLNKAQNKPARNLQLQLTTLYTTLLSDAQLYTSICLTAYSKCSYRNTYISIQQQLPSDYNSLHLLVVVPPTFGAM